MLSQPVTATATNVVLNFGPITWNHLRISPGGRWQVVDIMPTPNAVFFGSDGYPGGLHRVRRVGKEVTQIENAILFRDGAQSLKYLQMASYRARDLADAPLIVAFQGAGGGGNRKIVIAHPDGERVWTVWNDTADLNGGVTNIFGPTANGNVVATISTSSAPSGANILRAPMPQVPA